MFPIDSSTEAENLRSEQESACPQRHKVRPLTWMVAAALMPLLCYDVWQTLHDAKHRHEAHAAAPLSASSTASSDVLRDKPLSGSVLQ